MSIYKINLIYLIYDKTRKKDKPSIILKKDAKPKFKFFIYEPNNMKFLNKKIFKVNGK